MLFVGPGLVSISPYVTRSVLKKRAAAKIGDGFKIREKPLLEIVEPILKFRVVERKSNCLFPLKFPMDKRYASIDIMTLETK